MNAQPLSRAAAALLLLSALSGHRLAAQSSDVDEVDLDEPEGWAMAFFTSASFLTGFGAPDEIAPGSVALGGELGSIPRLSAAEQRVGFDGTKREDLNRTRVFGRIRARVGLPGGFALDLGWVPPVELDGAEPNLFSAAVGRTLVRFGDGRVGARLYGQVGSIQGDFTCPEGSVGEDVDGFFCAEPSNDEVEQRYLGLEGSLAWSMDSGRWEPYLTLAVNQLDLEFQVDARYRTDPDDDDVVVDMDRLTSSGTTLSGTVGTRFRLTDRIGVAGELFYTPLDVEGRNRQSGSGSGGGEDDRHGLFNLRLGLDYRIR